MVIRQSITLTTTANEIYKALTSAQVFGEVTGASASIDDQAGGAFSCFGGQITGRNIEIIRDKRIVQAWRVELWPKGVYSIVKFELRKSGNSTVVELEHAGFPEDAAEHLESGWHKMYWEPLKAYFG